MGYQIANQAADQAVDQTVDQTAVALQERFDDINPVNSGDTIHILILSTCISYSEFNSCDNYPNTGSVLGAVGVVGLINGQGHYPVIPFP